MVNSHPQILPVPSTPVRTPKNVWMFVHLLPPLSPQQIFNLWQIRVECVCVVMTAMELEHNNGFSRGALRKSKSLGRTFVSMPGHVSTLCLVFGVYHPLSHTHTLIMVLEAPRSGVGMKIWQCYDNLPAQQWYYMGDNRIALEGKGLSSSILH